MTRRTRPTPAYKARLAQRRERLAERAYWQAHIEGQRQLFEFQMGLLRDRKADLDANAPPLPHITPGRITRFFEQLFAAATDTTRRLAQDFTPKKGVGDARFFA